MFSVGVLKSAADKRNIVSMVVINSQVVSLWRYHHRILRFKHVASCE